MSDPKEYKIQLAKKISLEEDVDIIIIIFSSEGSVKVFHSVALVERTNIGSLVRAGCFIWAESESGPAVIIDPETKRAFAHDGTELIKVSGTPSEGLAPGKAAARKLLDRLAAELPDELIDRYIEDVVPF